MSSGYDVPSRSLFGRVDEETMSDHVDLGGAQSRASFDSKPSDFIWGSEAPLSTRKHRLRVARKMQGTAPSFSPNPTMPPSPTHFLFQGTPGLGTSHRPARKSPASTTRRKGVSAKFEGCTTDDSSMTMAWSPAAEETPTSKANANRSLDSNTLTELEERFGKSINLGFQVGGKEFARKASQESPPPLFVFGQAATSSFNLASKTPRAKKHEGRQAPRHHSRSLPSEQVIQNLKKESVLAAAQLENAAEALRERGNDAFKAGKYEKAYQFYSKAIQTLNSHPSPGKLLAIIFSNRAATSLQLWRPLSALSDCQLGLQHDPTYSRCALRMATIHTRMGNFSKANSLLMKMKAVVVADAEFCRKIDDKLTEVRSAEEIVMNGLAALGYALPNRTIKRTADVRALQNALQQLEEGALQVAPHFEPVHAARVESLLRLGNYRESLQVLELPRHLEIGSAPNNHRWGAWIRAQVYFHEGDYQACIGILKDLAEALQVEKANSLEKEAYVLLTVVIPLPQPEEVRKLIEELEKMQKLKGEGNEAMAGRRHQDAVAKYTEAINFGGSCGFLCVLLSNRAAAYQSLSNWTQAIADCCRAKALADNYAKAHSRLATLLLECNDYAGAAGELRTAISLPGLDSDTLSSYKSRLASAARLAVTLNRHPYTGTDSASFERNHYKLLSLGRSCSEADARKAYKRLALSFHPDKSLSVCRFQSSMSASGSVLAGTSEIAERIRQQASFLFQLLGTAHEVLIDSRKRRDLDGHLRNLEESKNADHYDDSDSFYRNYKSNHNAGPRRSGYYNFY